MPRAAASRLRGDGSLLLERERELAVFDSALTGAAAGEGSLLLVEGPAGIGKTRLLAEFAEIAKQRDVLVRSARAGQLEREMPFALTRQLLEPLVERAPDEEREYLLAGAAAPALAALGREDPADANPERDPYAPIHGLYWLVANLAEQRPLVLLADDGHWADAQTLRFLDYLARRLGDIPVLVAASVRSGEPDEPAELEPLRQEAQLVHPAPLSEGAITALITAELSDPAPEFARACAEASAGNPLLLTEIVRTLRADGLAPDADAAGSLTALGPESIARYVLLRLARFGQEAIALARAIAVLGSAPQLRHVAELAGLDEKRALELCDRLRDAEILAPGTPIEFVHPLVRSAIYTEMPEGERFSSHRRAAELLTEAAAVPDQVASHLMVCPPNGDQWVVGQLGAATFEAMRSGANYSAHSYLERALAEPPTDDVGLLFLLGMCKLDADVEHAPAVLSEVAERTTDPNLRVEALRFTAFAHIFLGDWWLSRDFFAEAIDALPDDDRERRLGLEAQLFFTAATVGRDPAASDRIEAVAATVGSDTAGECLVRQVLAFERFNELAPVDEVIELADSRPPPPWEYAMVIPTIGLGGKMLCFSGAWDKARQTWNGMIEFSQGMGRPIGISYGMGALSETDRLSGNLSDAEAGARTALELAEELAPDSNFAVNAFVSLLAALIARGEVDEAARLAKGSKLSGSTEAGATPSPIEVRGYLRLAQGELAHGVDDLLRFGEDVESMGVRNPALSPWRQEVAPALTALDRTGEAKELIEVAEERARKFGAAHALGTVLRARGLIEPRKRQIETFEESVEMLEQYGPPHELARSLVELGAAMRRDGQRSDSREPLRRAMELAHKSGAGGTEQRAREELAAAGSRPRSVMRTGVSALTASELRTAKLAAEGLQNTEIAQRLFVSKKTVEKHLGNVYMKLEIEGRGELAAALDQDGGG